MQALYDDGGDDDYFYVPMYEFCPLQPKYPDDQNTKRPAPLRLPRPHTDDSEADQPRNIRHPERGFGGYVTRTD